MSETRFIPQSMRTEVTSPEVFNKRRAILKTLAVSMVPGVPGLCCGEISGNGQEGGQSFSPLESPLSWPEGMKRTVNQAFTIPEGLRSDLTPRLAAATHNNYYEFLFGGGGPVWKHTGKFVVDPWTVEVGGLCRKPLKLGLEDLFRFPHEERLYHFRCVERWAMNVPWSGFPLRVLLEKVEPKPEAKFVRFVSAHRPEQMPGLKHPGAASHTWPYHEGLRIDEAMHEMAFVATGVYGAPLLKQHGSPLRIVVPWKYGYKNPKSIVRIELVAEQPPTYWSRAPYQHEYGFLSNINPNIPHPRWSQKQSYWLDTREKFDTPVFNGYEKEVGGLYPDEPTTLQKPVQRGKKAR